LIVSGQRISVRKNRSSPDKYRNHGVGISLVKAVLHRAKFGQRPAPVYVATAAWNTPFFEHRGFKRIEAKSAKEENPILGRKKHWAHTVLVYFPY
jgi:N-acetylglutamate synthase-like GNAT family acetyltransferase